MNIITLKCWSCWILKSLDLETGKSESNLTYFLRLKKQTYESQHGFFFLRVVAFK